MILPHNIGHRVKLSSQNHWDLMPERRVFPLPIIIRFNVFKDTGLSHTSRHVPLAMHEFDFQGMKEALRHGVIVAGGFAPHTPRQPMGFDQLLIASGTILTATIGMDDRSLGKPAATHGHEESLVGN